MSMMNLIKLSRLFNQTRHFVNITPLSCNILSFLRISRLQSTYKTFPFANYNRLFSRSHVKVSPFLFCESFIPIPQRTLLNRCQSCYYSSSSSSTNDGSDDYNDSFKEFDDDPEIQSLLQNIKGDFKVFTNEELDENNVRVSENVSSEAKRLSDSNVIRFESESDSESSEESEDSDIEDFLDSGFMADDTEIEEFEIPQYVPPIELKRGKTGVFDLDELATVLKEENARDLCVISVPADINYVDYLVLVSGISPRHIKAMAELMKWLVILPSTYFFHTSVNCMTSRPYGLSELNTMTSAKRLKRNTSYQTQACFLREVQTPKRSKRLPKPLRHNN
ncbi:uncharacterized protein LOC115215017 isoform X2 [Octopus sinensis]|uniref:Uncharacterized protein LOC115215017 isoform X2 n=1 Tax=Octopus sinensis TaxID=2607531 RepID=A0A7E6F1G1_9MOLL|nr:uncharacterized protein LOC115215017 isoform X2 [Octopus sinensis]XP_036361372.1 uncharacterized protein LOC115215017 isoform X2 [Octopus sinensis]XP_036361373.1 uncharacterized protein LOC115215017 isoform X2 [Octopus sinensis]